MVLLSLWSRNSIEPFVAKLIKKLSLWKLEVIIYRIACLTYLAFKGQDKPILKTIFANFCSKQLIIIIIMSLKG